MADADGNADKHGLWHVGDELDGLKEEAVAAFRLSVGELRAKLDEDEKDDPMIVQKYLNARQWKVDKAVEMFKFSVNFRQGEYATDRLLQWTPPERLLRYQPGGMFGVDKEGHPVSWLLAGRADFRGVYRLGTKKEHSLFRHWQLNLLIRNSRIQTKMTGKYVGQSTLIIDLDGLGWSTMYLPMLRLFNEINQTAQMVYPDVLRRIIIINPPGIFSAIFAMCKPFLMQRLIDKIIVVSGDAYAALKEHIPNEYIPKMYGGEAPDPDPSGNAIVTRVAEQTAARCAFPTEREFVQATATERQGKWTWNDALVNGLAPIVIPGKIPEEEFAAVAFDPEGAETVSVGAGAAAYVTLVVKTAGQLLSWEFKSENGDIGFQLSFAPSGTDVPEKSAGPVVIVPLEKVASHVVPEAGQHECAKPGTYVIAFDNKDSWVSSRKVLHRIRVEAEVPLPTKVVSL